MNPLLETAEIRDAPDVDAPGAADLKAEMLAHFDTATCSAEMLAQVAVPPREPIVGEWFKQGDLGFIYGARGLGKTWLAMLLARKCARVAAWLIGKSTSPGACFTLTVKCRWTVSASVTRRCPPPPPTECFICNTRLCFISPARF